MRGAHRRRTGAAPGGAAGPTSLGQRDEHPDRTVALAPAIGALAGTNAAELWRLRSTATARVYLGLAVAASAVWAFVLLGSWLPWLRWTVLALGVVAAGALLGVHRFPRLLSAGVVTAAVLASLGGTAAWSVATAAQPHSGAIPSSGPSGVGRGPGGTGGPGGPRGGFGGAGMRGGFRTGQVPGGTGGPGGPRGGFGGAGMRGGFRTGQVPGGQAGVPGAPGGTPAPGVSPGTVPGPIGTGGTGFGGMRGGMGGVGSLLGTTTPPAAVTTPLQENASDYTWVAAAVGSNAAAGYQLAAEDPVMAVGGFNGTDPAPTLAQFQQYAAEGKIHWFVGGAGSDARGSDTGGSDAAAEIAEWVQQHFTAQTVDGVTLYDLTGGTAV
ncbi:hypothetical protein ACQP04_09185 [Pseudonocardia halophobica]|uniref:hypothetical protein n=1 Tax=Pseudonocardia halophobica TaxID=29401 RepID=UPI003D8C7849